MIIFGLSHVCLMCVLGSLCVILCVCVFSDIYLILPGDLATTSLSLCHHYDNKVTAKEPQRQINSI